MKIKKRKSHQEKPWKPKIRIRIPPPNKVMKSKKDYDRKREKSIPDYYE